MAFDPTLLVPRPVPGARVRLFCFPYAGAGAALFRGWPRLLPPDVEVCAVELPGRGCRLADPPRTRLATLAEETATALVPHLDRRFAFFGHSMGGLLAFEVARELRRRSGPQPSRLLVSASPAPHLERRRRQVHALSDAELIEELRRMNGTPSAVLGSEELMALLLPTLRADFAVVETYRYATAPPLECPIAAFGGADDRMVPARALDAWRQHTRGAFSLVMVPGDHFFVSTNERRLLSLLTDVLGAPPRPADEPRLLGL